VWVSLQRSAYAAGALSADRVALLQQVPGWQWSELPRWEKGLARLREYVQVHGTADIPAAATHADFDLGHWVSRQREDHRAGSLTAAQEAAVQALPGWRWAPPAELWRSGYETLLTYLRDHGKRTPGVSGAAADSLHPNLGQSCPARLWEPEQGRYPGLR